MFVARGDYSLNHVFEMRQIQAQTQRKDTANGGDVRRRRRRLCLGLFVAYFNLHNLAMKNNGFNNVQCTSKLHGPVVVRLFRTDDKREHFRMMFFLFRPRRHQEVLSRLDNESEHSYSMALCISAVGLYV